jgi:hypothetical protein
MDDPTPIEFWSVKPGVKFLFPIQGPEGWREAAVEILKATLTQYGLGAKTNAGYGLFELEGKQSNEPGSGAVAGETVVVTFKEYKNNDAVVWEQGQKDDTLCSDCPPGLLKGQKINAVRRGRRFVFASLLED